MSDVTLNPSITPSFTTTSEIQNVQAPAAEETKQSYTPLWMVNDSIGSNAFEMLGMRLPKASGDIAAILAQISLTLELSIGESDKNKALSGFARMASALGAYGVNSLREMIGRNEQGVTDATERVTDYNEASASLVSDRNTLNTKIGNYNSEISTLEHDISSLQGEKSALEEKLKNAKDSEKPGIQAEIDQKTASINAKTADLNTAKTNRNQALADRKAIEISLSELKIETLAAEITDLQAQLALAPEESEEATKLTALISDLNGKLSSMQGDLSHLRTDPYTESSGNSRFASTDSSFTGGFSSVKNTLGQLVSDGLTTLQNVGTMVLAIIAQAAASLNAATHAGEVGQREIMVERGFEDISDELKAASQRLQNILLNPDRSGVTGLGRIEDIARGLLAAIADIVQALDGLDAAAGGAPPAGQTVGNRLRLGV
jgi:TolA-binding protein